MGLFASQVRVVGVSAVSHATRRRGLGVSPSPAHALHEPDDLGRPSRPVRFDELHDADAAHLQKFTAGDSLTRVSNRRLWPGRKMLHSGFRFWYLQSLAFIRIPLKSRLIYDKVILLNGIIILYYIIMTNNGLSTLFNIAVWKLVKMNQKQLSIVTNLI